MGTALLDLAMPRLCVVCGCSLLLREKHVCTSCLAELPLTRFWNQSRNAMADKYNEWIQRDGCYEPYAYACALFYYFHESPYRNITPQLKYKRNTRMGRFFGAMLGRRLTETSFYTDVDMVIPVPLHPLRRWKRGYNQAEIIAAELVSELSQASAGHKVELRTDIIRRVRYTRSQTALSGAAKESNVSSAFALSRKMLAGYRSAVLPSHVLLVDDVYTSGSTIDACRRTLRKIFPASVRISVATLAFVGTE